MKIGILTYHRAENYGALLQAYALKTYLQSLGHDVSFVDYWPKYHSDYFKLFPWQQIKKRHGLRKLFFLIQLVLWLVPRYVRKKRFCNFIQKRLDLPITPKYTDDDSKTEKYDVVVYGSDQIWRKQNLGGVGFDDWYFGSENVLANKKIVYAGSMGEIDTNAKDDEYVKKMMQNFCKISVRENDLQSYLSKLGMTSSLVTDPVFLISKEQWRIIEKTKVQKGKYILFYNLLNTSDSKRFAEQLSKKTNLPIRELNKKMSPSHIGKRYISTASVEEFLQLIDGAEYVVSNSFHGVAMSIIFEKPFFAVGMGKKANRVKSLLHGLGISQRYIEHVGIAQQSQIINYQDLCLRFHELVNYSQLYLQNSIKNETVVTL